MSYTAKHTSHPVAARVAVVGPCLTAGLAIVCGGVAWLFNSVVGGVSLVLGFTTAAALVLAADRVRRLTRWTVSAGVVTLAALPVALLSVSLAIAVSRFDPRNWLCAGLAFAALAAALWRRAVTQSDARWAAKSWANEHEVLDLDSGTYDLSRHFQLGESGHSRSAMWLDRWAPALGPSVIALFAGAGRHGLGDIRATFLLCAGPTVFLLFLPPVAQGVVSYQKVREYELRLGRELVNR